MGSGGAGSGDAKRVVVKKIELHSDDLKQPLIMDLTLAPEKIKEQTFKVKEGAEYQLHFFFQVNNEILSGLRYSQVNSHLPKEYFRAKMIILGGEKKRCSS